MGQDSLDQIKDMLYDHEVAINNDQLWGGITRKRKIANRKMVLGSIAAIALLITAFMLGQKFAPQSNDIESNEKFIAIDHITENQTTNNTGLNLDSGEISESHNSSTHQANSNTKEINEPNNNFDESLTTKKTNQISESHTNSEDNDNEIILSDNSGKVLVTEPTEVKPFTYKISATPPVEKIYLNNAATGSTRDKRFHYLNDVQHIADLDMYPLSLGKNQKQLQLKLSNDIECYDYKGKKNNIYAVAYTSADINMQRLSSSLENTDYKDSRDATESSLLSYHAGLQLKYLFDNGLYLKGGIEYGEVRERFAYRRTTEVTEILPNQIIGFEIDVNGDTTIVLGNAPVTTITMKNWRLGNTYKTLDFTALAGYQISSGSWVYSAELGASYNTRFSFSGLILDETGEPFPADNYFNDRIDWSILGAFNIGYKMNSKTTVFTGMNFKSMLSPVNSTVNVIDQKYNRFGLHLGVEFKLN